MNLDERAVFAQFSKNYALVNPPPEIPIRANWQSLGLMFVLKIITGLAAIGLVALRTAGEFYRAAQIAFGSNAFAFSEAIFAVIGIEGTMFVLGATMAQKKKGVTNDTVAYATVGLTLLISLIAGFAHSLGVIDDLPEAVYNVITIVLSVVMTFASLVAYFSGELIGSDIVKLDIEYRRNLAKYNDDMDTWRTALANSWRSSAERRLARQDIKTAMREIQSNSPAENYGNFRKVSTTWDNPHWRSLPNSEKEKIPQMELSEIMAAYNVSERTARNWTEYASNGKER